jgi:hypothetical protein
MLPSLSKQLSGVFMLSTSAGAHCDLTDCVHAVLSKPPTALSEPLCTSKMTDSAVVISTIAVTITTSTWEIPFTTTV